MCGAKVSELERSHIYAKIRTLVLASPIGHSPWDTRLQHHGEVRAHRWRPDRFDTGTSFCWDLKFDSRRLTEISHSTAGREKSQDVNNSSGAFSLFSKL
ncbi:hypothetical protein BDV41DRAFT_545398 [Aspergillus transmontanensis]|uniref:Uncharacterized protein n=1 Tax=Aspergillus transmontanensis TaxID=1034304 RepID=A0A5N6VPI9_9EURO|nr:hypothetical protein BDV41DRAFT_545398 [Aspergillus transmontanensis]